MHCSRVLELVLNRYCCFLGLDPQWMAALQSAAKTQIVGSHTSESVNVTGDLSSTQGNSSKEPMLIGIFKIPVAKSRRRRAAEGDLQGTHKLLHDLTHSFHLGSLIILSMLLLEVSCAWIDVYGSCSYEFRAS